MEKDSETKDEDEEFIPTCNVCGRKMRKRVVRGGVMGSFETWDCPFCHP
jgi:hypothetical protein